MTRDVFVRIPPFTMAGAVMCRVCLMVRGAILNIGGDLEVAYLNRVANSRVRSVRWASSTDLTFF